MATPLSPKLSPKLNAVKHEALALHPSKSCSAALFDTFEPSRAVEQEVPDGYTFKPCKECGSLGGKLYFDPKSKMRLRVCECGCEKLICGAKTKSGFLCNAHPMAGRWRCKYHGGNALIGMSNHAFKGAGYSAHLPPRLASRFEHAMNDPDLLSARSESALLQVRIQEVVRRLRSGESGALWKKLLETYSKLEASFAKGDVDVVAFLLSDIGKIIRQGNKQEKVWRELSQAIEDKTRIAARENTRQKELAQILTAEQAIKLISTVLLAVRKHVADRGIQNAIGREVELILNSDGSYRPLPPRKGVSRGLVPSKWGKDERSKQMIADRSLEEDWPGGSEGSEGAEGSEVVSEGTVGEVGAVNEGEVRTIAEPEGEPSAAPAGPADAAEAKSGGAAEAKSGDAGGAGGAGGVE